MLKHQVHYHLSNFIKIPQISALALKGELQCCMERTHYKHWTWHIIIITTT